MPSLATQITWLIILAIPIACVARTIVFEEIFKEPRDYCRGRCSSEPRWYVRKFFYLFTCEYCFSHYVTIFFIWFANYKLLLGDWRGYVIAFFALVFVANAYLNLYARLRVDIEQAKVETKVLEKHAQPPH